MQKEKIKKLHFTWRTGSALSRVFTHLSNNSWVVIYIVSTCLLFYTHCYIRRHRKVCWTQEPAETPGLTSNWGPRGRWRWRLLLSLWGSWSTTSSRKLDFGKEKRLRLKGKICGREDESKNNVSELCNPFYQSVIGVTRCSLGSLNQLNPPSYSVNKRKVCICPRNQISHEM